MTRAAATPRRRGSLTAAVLKAMSVFSGVQMASIGCSVVRTKLVALWIGTAGVGLFGIYNSAVDMLSTLTLLSIGVSAVRDMARAERERVAYVAWLIRRWGLMLGLLGMAVMLLGAPLLSRLSFGDDAHTAMFRMLSPVLLLTALSTTRQAVLQGLHRLRPLARASVVGAVAGVALSIPLFYWLRLDGIVPSIIVSAAALCTAVWMNSRHAAPRPDAAPTWRSLWNDGRGFIALGAMMTASNFATYLSGYAFISWLNTHAGTDTTGLFQAGYTLFNRYIGLVFTAISVEFYPRLSAVAASRRATRAYVAHEICLLMPLLAAALAVFIPVLPLLVRLLYAKPFLTMVPFVAVASVGTVFRGLSWCMAFTMLARGDGRAYLVTEFTSAALYFVLNVAFYNAFGLMGLGWAYVLWYALYTVAVALVYRRRYRLGLPPRPLWLGLGALAVAAAAAFVLLRLII